MSADEEAKRMIREAIAEGWRRLWHELGATELAPGARFIDLSGLEHAQLAALQGPHAERTAAAIEHYGAALVLAQPALAAQRRLPN